MVQNSVTNCDKALKSLYSRALTDRLATLHTVHVYTHAQLIHRMQTDFQCRKFHELTQCHDKTVSDAIVTWVVFFHYLQ